MGWVVRVYPCYYLRPTIPQRVSLNGQWWLSRLLDFACDPISTPALRDPALRDPALSLVTKTFDTHLLCRSMLFQMFYIVQGTLQNEMFPSHWNKPFPLSLPNIDRDIRISSVNSWEAHVNIYITLRVDITDSYSLINCLWDSVLILQNTSFAFASSFSKLSCCIIFSCSKVAQFFCRTTMKSFFPSNLALRTACLL